LEQVALRQAVVLNTEAQAGALLIQDKLGQAEVLLVLAAQQVRVVAQLTHQTWQLQVVLVESVMLIPQVAVLLAALLEVLITEVTVLFLPHLVAGAVAVAGVHLLAQRLAMVATEQHLRVEAAVVELPEPALLKVVAEMAATVSAVFISGKVKI
jgi:hypothetical protein